MYTKKTRNSIEYAQVDSVTLPIPHSVNLPIPAPPGHCSDPQCMDESSDDAYEENPAYQQPEEDRDQLYIPDSVEPHMLSQGDFNDLVRDLYLTKEMSELLGSRLQQWKLLDHSVRVTAARWRSDNFAKWFEEKDGICYCKDIPMLFAEMKQPFIPNEWRLFIDGSKTSIKTVLLHTGNDKPSVPVAFSQGLKEEYDTMKAILDLIQYDTHNFKIVADFKVIAILMGIQGGNVKFPCFLCLFDSRDYNDHFVRPTWEARTEFVPGRFNVKSVPLVSRDQIILPALHIKLGLKPDLHLP